MGPVLITVVAGLGGCATAPVPVPATADRVRRLALYQRRAAALASLPGFVVQARAALRLDRPDRAEGGSVRLEWRQQRAGGFQLDLSLPLGRGHWWISGAGAEAPAQPLQAVAPDGSPYRFERASDFFLSTLGAPLEPSWLAEWMLGLAGPASAEAASTELDERGRLQRLEWQGYRLLVEEYRSGVSVPSGKGVDAEGLSLPHRLRLERPGFLLRLVVDRWQLQG